MLSQFHSGALRTGEPGGLGGALFATELDSSHREFGAQPKVDFAGLRHEQSDQAGKLRSSH